MKIIKILLMCSLFAVASCSKIDDYMLGKDNTPTPTPLTELKPKVKVVEVWRKPVGSKGGNRTDLKLEPVVSGNVVYTADYNGMMTATKSNDASTLWQERVKANIVSGPVASDKYLAVATADARVIVADKKTGKVLWAKPISNEALSPPTISQGRVLAKTIDGKLYAFDAATGKKQWVYEHGSPNLILRSGSSPIVKGKLIVVGFADGKLDGVNLETGQLLWQRSISYASGSSDIERLVDIDATPILKNDIVYVANYQGYVTALSLQTGQFLWRHKLSTFKDLGIDSGSVFATDSNDVVWAVSRNSGKTQWHQDHLKARNISAPAYSKNKIFVGDSFGYLHLLASNDGELLSRVLLPGAINNAPVIKGNDAYVFTNDGILVKLKVG